MSTPRNPLPLKCCLLGIFCIAGIACADADKGTRAGANITFANLTFEAESDAVISPQRWASARSAPEAPSRGSGQNWAPGLEADAPASTLDSEAKNLIGFDEGEPLSHQRRELASVCGGRGCTFTKDNSGMLYLLERSEADCSDCPQNIILSIEGFTAIDPVLFDVKGVESISDV